MLPNSRSYMYKLNYSNNKYCKSIEIVPPEETTKIDLELLSPIKFKKFLAIRNFEYFRVRNTK